MDTILAHFCYRRDSRFRGNDNIFYLIVPNISLFGGMIHKKLLFLLLLKPRTEKFLCLFYVAQSL